MGFVFYCDLAISSNRCFNRRPFGYVFNLCHCQRAKFKAKMPQKDQDSIDRHSEKKNIRNQFKMESIVLLFSTIAVTGLAVFIIFWLFVVHII